jgi:hypothetical protein
MEVGNNSTLPQKYQQTLPKKYQLTLLPLVVERSEASNDGFLSVERSVSEVRQ